MSSTTSKPEVVLSTSVTVVGGLMGGFLLGRLTKRRSVTGAVFGGVGILVGTQWFQNRGPATAALLGIVYVGAVRLSDPFGTRLLRLPAVILASGLTAVAAYTLHDKYITIGLDPAERPSALPD
jgi:hypothetical protein